MNNNGKPTHVEMEKKTDSNLKILITDYPNFKCILQLEFVPCQSIGCERLRFSRHPPHKSSDDYLSRELQQNSYCELARFSSLIFDANIYTAGMCVCCAGPSNDRYKNATVGGRLYSWLMSRLK